MHKEHYTIPDMKASQRCYFAHHITDYDTPREAEAVRLLEQHGFTVVNPNGSEHDAAYKHQGMQYFLGMVATCDALAFQRFATGQVGAGVGKEIHVATAYSLPVYEIADNALRQVDGATAVGDAMSVDETRALLRAIRASRQ